MIGEETRSRGAFLYPCPCLMLIQKSKNIILINYPEALFFRSPFRLFLLDSVNVNVHFLIVKADSASDGSAFGCRIPIPPKVILVLLPVEHNAIIIGIAFVRARSYGLARLKELKIDTRLG